MSGPVVCLDGHPLSLSPSSGRASPGAAGARPALPPFSRTLRPIRSWLERPPSACPGSASALRLGPVLQFAAQDLADRRARQRLAELDMTRRLVAGEMLAAVGDDLGVGDGGVLAHDHDLDRLAGLGVRHAERADLMHARVGHHHVLDLVRIDVEAGDENHVLLPVDDEEIAALVDPGDVAGLQVAVRGHHMGRLVRLHPVAGHHLRSLDAKLARLSHRRVAPLRCRGWRCRSTASAGRSSRCSLRSPAN